MYRLRYRQVHLDYHTSPEIPGIGKDFNQREYQRTLKAGHVDSITTFSKCHHGWSYHPTKVGKMHPHLSFNLLRKQLDACKAIDVNVPIYLSAGVDNVASVEHPEWREVGANGQYQGWTREILQAGFHKMCFNSPYLDYLCRQIEEVARLFKDGDGFFLDIISQGQCCCKWCLAVMRKQGLDPLIEADRRACAQIALERYYRTTTAACRVVDAKKPVFHNSGHITRGSRDILKYFSHLELESLPTGGWGYDHFPLSAGYARGLKLDFLGMTGKFHMTWGEFGGFKHPHALRYECAAMLAYGSKCSVGDQLHPGGKLDASTYDLIGAAYAEVEQKEPWCDRAVNVAEIGVLSAASLHPGGARDDHPDTGACRILLEGQFLFDVLDAGMDFSPYRLLILPDTIRLPKGALRDKLIRYWKAGGRILLTGDSGLDENGKPVFPLGGKLEGVSPFSPDYVLPVPGVRPEFLKTPLVMYLPSRRLRVTTGQSLGPVYDPYFNRRYDHFCSHQHTPNRTQASPYACGVQQGRILYLAHPVFSMYRGWGAVPYRHYVTNAIRRLLGDPMVETSLPSTARLTLTRQAPEKRWILHLLSASPIRRGGAVELRDGDQVFHGRDVEVIEDLTPVRDTRVLIRLPGGRVPRTVTLEPQGKPVAFERTGDGIELMVDTFTCHQMVVLAY
ncbi:MAG: hypothetical protein A2498_11395 [Lentisphaerae bacterium RIFOXYC12_FULL_60_16]|nr:MAG: hypothetical protein A2498_11395 [Lentisphaerae bacterium RIFOXYC12_FULL_60_16]OGV71872.1 MAG: hypothetical protein A2269_00835 [Lentisphaerae bacterium RIFOXYA12_FULL_60_10]OGV85738.1 MAG: hypothetical protein A2340_15380 [Lentisphaerae bacterium RIFOXYB12_FULL_60_10]